ncbi:MAG: cation:proton antiporter [Deltaproteobacteria bacterium]|nr:cation:proton antiporter [Deltaproteobacteria bacterium]
MSLQLLILFLVIVLVALLGSRARRGRVRMWPLQRLLQTGTPFVFVGFLMGPQGFGLVPGGLLDQLRPIVILGFGWIGFLYGSHFEWRRIRRFGARMYGGGITESVVTMGVVGLAVYWVLPLLYPGMQEALREHVAVGLAACAGGTAPAGVFALTRQRGVSARDSELLRFFSAVDDLPPVLLLGVFFALWDVDGGGVASAPERLAMSVVLGTLLGLGSHLLLPSGRDSASHAFLLILGMGSLCAGAAEMLLLSPLFVAVLGGMVFANLSPRKEDIYGLMERREHTLYAVFLIVAGALFRWEAVRVVLLLAPGYVILRGAAKVAGAWLGTRGVLREGSVHGMLGTGLVFQGGMGLAIAVHLELNAGAAAGLFMTTVVLAVVLNDLIGLPIAVQALGRRRR